jgi:GDP-mannose 4,6-dehydratase
MSKKTLITGINGQDGSYLAEFLLVKRNSVSETQSTRIEHLRSSGKINLEYADLTDMSSLVRVLKEVQPDEVYNLAAQSHVRVSFDQPIYTANVTGLGTLNLLEAVRMVSPHIKQVHQKCLVITLMMMDTKEKLPHYHQYHLMGVQKYFLIIFVGTIGILMI